MVVSCIGMGDKFLHTVTSRRGRRETIRIESGETEGNDTEIHLRECIILNKKTF